MKKALKWVGIGLLAFTVLGIIAVATDDSKETPEEKKDDPKNSPTEVVYRTVKEEKSGDAVYLRVTVNDRYDKKELIDILRKSKEEYKTTGELVIWFYIKQFSESGAWASASYLPNCPECMTEKDSDGNPAEYRLIGVTKAKADSLRQLTLDTIANKKLVATYIEDIARCKTEIYEVDGNPKRLLMAQIFAPREWYLQWLKLKVVDGEDRYYFENETDGEGNYMINEWGIKVVHFRNKEGKEWLTFPSE